VEKEENLGKIHIAKKNNLRKAKWTPTSCEFFRGGGGGNLQTAHPEARHSGVKKEEGSHAEKVPKMNGTFRGGGARVGISCRGEGRF